MVGEEMREAVEARECREGAEDFVEAREAVEGRAERAAILPGMMNQSRPLPMRNAQARRA